LDRYQEIMRLPINAFNGLNQPEENPQYECSTIWGQSDRDYIAEHLAQSEEMRRRELGYYLAPRYEVCDFEFGAPLIIDRKYLIQIGTQTTEDVSIGEALTLGVETAPNDPVTVTIATTLTDASEIKVYYPGEDVEIRPSSVSITGGNLNISIPRARLVDPSLNDNREDHLSYYVNANFLTTIDVKRVYYDISTGLSYLWEGWQVSCSSLADTGQVGWHRIRNARLGMIDHRPASYTGSVASQAVWSHCVLPLWVRLRFQSGRRASMATEIETVRLSHTLMPNKPSSCPTVHQYWEEDIYEDERPIYTPYGSRRGAMRAWVSDSRAKVGMGGKFPSGRRGGV
jgi:hypothetical protein